MEPLGLVLLIVGRALGLQLHCPPAPRFQVLEEHGLGFRVQGLGLRVQGLGFKVEGLGLRVKGLGPWRVRGTS